MEGYTVRLFNWARDELELQELPVFNEALAGKHMVSYFAK